MLLAEENEIVNDDGKIATIVNRYFTNITKHINLKTNKSSHKEEIIKILDTFKNHKSVQRKAATVFWNYAAYLQENTHADVWFQWSCKGWKHFGMGVLLYIYYIFPENFFLKTLLDGCFWED